MTVSRRDLIAAGLLSAFASSIGGGCTQPGRRVAPSSSPPPQIPPPEIIALNRLAYGPRPGDVRRVRRMGLPAYINEQLNPDDESDPQFLARVRCATLQIEYEGGNGYKAKKEKRPLQYLDKAAVRLWTLANESNRMDWAERVRPAEEIRSATFLRAVYSRWQLREILVEFWHNHFNVNAYADEQISAMWPIYDRDVIRKNCFGNFRNFLEDVAKSAAMQFYLDNASSKASPANENYARELFELHTLGAEHYFNHLYDRWRDVPGALNGRPIGYIDQDIYEAARAFTGWTIANGNDSGRGEVFPNNGEFLYFEGWHDPYQKRVLGVEFDSHQPAMSDGKKVLDLLASHRGTARHICLKLCRRLIADYPSAALVEAASDVWLANKNEPDQIKQTVRFILSSGDFACTWGQKVKRPFELIVSFLRATDADFKPTADLFWSMSQMGYRLFEWPTPDGHPDTAEHWLGTNVMLGRWNMISRLLSDWFGVASFKLLEQMPEAISTPRQIVDFWLSRLLPQPISQGAYDQLLSFAAQGGDPNSPAAAAGNDLRAHVGNIVALISMSPQYQVR